HALPLSFLALLLPVFFTTLHLYFPHLVSSSASPPTELYPLSLHDALPIFVGTPTLTLSPPTKSTLSKVNEAPSSTLSFSTKIDCPSSTFTCFPPVSMIANILTPPII